MIKKSVGTAGVNRPEDVREVQGLLNRFANRLQMEPLDVDGLCGPATRAAILDFQQDVVDMDVPDGRIDPKGPTWKALQRLDTTPDAPVHAVQGPLADLLKPGPHTPLQDADFDAAALKLGCDVLAIRAVAKVESSRSPFDDKGRPTILYERHLFHRLTNGDFDQHPDLSNREAGGYGTFASQYGKLERAFALDQEAALKACSWGMFQILGSNHRITGFDTVFDFVRAMCDTQLEHLKAFVNFIEANRALQSALQAREWAQFARWYNGPAFHKNQYDVRMAQAYRDLRGE